MKNSCHIVVVAGGPALMCQQSPSSSKCLVAFATVAKSDITNKHLIGSFFKLTLDILIVGNGIFEVADLWTDSTEEWQYIVFINKL